MSATTLAEPTTPRRRPDDPFRIGYRYVHSVDATGQTTSVKVPLTEEDFLHPQEGDRFMLTDPHSIAVHYLRHALRLSCRERPPVRVFTDHRVDWQVAGVKPHGPDVVVFDRFPADWDSDNATLAVADLDLVTLAVFEVTSAETRHVDLGRKFDEFEDVGIPYYLVVDLAAPDGEPRLLGFRRVASGFREMRRDPRLGFLIPSLALWFRYENDRLIVADEDGNDVPDSPEIGFALAAAKQLAEAEKARAEAEKQRAEAAEKLAVDEKARADAEKARADALAVEAANEKAMAAEIARELAELKARLASNG